MTKKKNKTDLSKAFGAIESEWGQKRREDKMRQIGIQQQKKEKAKKKIIEDMKESGLSFELLDIDDEDSTKM